MKALAFAHAVSLCACFSLRGIDTSRTTNEGPVCGNGVRDQDEACDGQDLGQGSRACITRGAGAAGELGCAATCELDTTGCLTEQTGNLRLWLSANAKDAAAVSDHSVHAVLFSSTMPGFVALSSSVAVATDPPRDRAFELTQGPGHSVYIAASVAALTPMTYELWLSPTDASPSDHDTVVFEHETACLLALVPAGTDFHVRATCGAATVENPAALPPNTYSFVAVQVAKATVSLWVGKIVASATRGPVLSGTGKFAFGNTLSDADAKQFIGRIDELRLVGIDRTDHDLCMDAGGEGCD